MNAKVIIHPDVEALTEGVAGIFVQAARSSVGARGRFATALSGGSTPRRLYRRLAAEPFASELPWDQVHLFWGDERTVPPDHEESNFRMVREEMIVPLRLPRETVHRMSGEIDPEEAAGQYEEEMRRFFGRDEDFPRFDLMLLGMGDDGHTASLFPETAALDEDRRWAVANPVPKLETTRLTLTVPVLNHARTVLFLIAGKGKAAVVREVLEGACDPARFPSQFVVPSDGELLFCLDQEAGSLLSGKGPYTMEGTGVS